MKRVLGILIAFFTALPLFAVDTPKPAKIKKEVKQPVANTAVADALVLTCSTPTTSPCRTRT